MTRIFTTAAALGLSLAAALPAAASASQLVDQPSSQLITGAGLTPAGARGMSLTEIAAGNNNGCGACHAA